MKYAIIFSALALWSAGALAQDSEECTHEAAKDMYDELKDDLSSLTRSMYNNKLIPLRKEKVGLVLVTQPLPLPDRLKALPNELAKVEALLQNSSPSTCDEIEKLRRKYRL